MSKQQKTNVDGPSSTKSDQPGDDGKVNPTDKKVATYKDKITKIFDQKRPKGKK